MPSASLLILAAGASRRLGRPKALLEFDDRPVVELIADTAHQAGVSSGVLVVAKAEEDLVAELPPWLQTVRNDFPAAGRMGSLQVGLSALPQDEDILLWPVDRPLASVETVTALLAGEAEPNDWIVPRCDGGVGHPLILRAGLRPSLRSLPPDASLRDVLDETGGMRVEIHVNDAGIHHNLDTEEAYRAAIEWWNS